MFGKHLHLVGLLAIGACDWTEECTPFGSPLLLSFAGELAACGQPLHLNAMGESPKFRWSEAHVGDTYDLEVRGPSKTVWSVLGVPAEALLRQEGAGGADGPAGEPQVLWSVREDAQALALHANGEPFKAVLSQGGRTVATSTFRTFSCTGDFHVSYGTDGDANCGAELHVSKVQTAPTVSAPEVRADAWYTLIMIDEDAFSWEDPTISPLAHAIYTNISGSQLASPGGFDLSAAPALLGYMGPAGLGPGSYPSPHRYTWYVYEQPGQLDIPPLPRDPATFDGRLNFAQDKWTETYNLQLTHFRDYFRSWAAMRDHTSCDGLLKVQVTSSTAADCKSSFLASEVVSAPTVSLNYPYFMDSLRYTVLAVDDASGHLVWLVTNVLGRSLNAGSDLSGSDVIVPYEAPTIGSQILFLMYVQPTILPPLLEPSSRTNFDQAAWAAAYGISKPSASNGFHVQQAVKRELEQV